MTAIEQTDMPESSGLNLEYHLLPNRIGSLTEANFDREPVAEDTVESLDIYRTREAFWDDGAINQFAARYTCHLYTSDAADYLTFLTTGDGAAI